MYCNSKSGIKKGSSLVLDPNPSHSGIGLELMRGSGLEVELAPDALREKATRLNFIFNHNMRSGAPLIALKRQLTTEWLRSPGVLPAR